MTVIQKKYKAFISYSHGQDVAVAGALERSLRTFARPWNRSWAVRIFRDESNLSISPNLWGEVEKSLLDSEYLIFLASPLAAKSKWVSKELDTFLAQSGNDRLLIVLTSGEILWDESNHDFDWTVTTAVPLSLKGKLSIEPKFLDLRWASNWNDELIQGSKWKDSIADLSSVLQNISKDELYGADARQRRKQRVVYSAAIAALILVPLAFAGTSYYLSKSSDESISGYIEDSRADHTEHSLMLLQAEEAYDQGDYEKAFQLFERAAPGYTTLGAEDDAIRERRDRLLTEVLKDKPTLELSSWKAKLKWMPRQTKAKIDDPLGYVANVHKDLKVNTFEARRGIQYMQRLIAQEDRIDVNFSTALGDWNLCWSAAMNLTGMTTAETRKPCVGSVQRGKVVLRIPQGTGGEGRIQHYTLSRLDSKTLYVETGTPSSTSVGVLYQTREGQMVILMVEYLATEYDSESGRDTYKTTTHWTLPYWMIVCSR